MTIEDRIDISFVAALARREKQIQQNYRPIIAVHKWFARRPGTLFRALALAEFGKKPLAEQFYESNDFPNVKIADPFMGGGTPLIEANRIGCDVYGIDINPMSAWIVREEIEHLNLNAYHETASRILDQLRAELGDLYVTDCSRYGDKSVPVKYFLWVKVADCEGCGHSIDLFPGYLLSEDSRHPRNVLVCPDCGELNEVFDRNAPGECQACSARLRIEGPANRGKCACAKCGHENIFPRSSGGPPGHRLFALEYYNPIRKRGHAGRFFKKPDEHDLKRVAYAEHRWHETIPHFVPEQRIPAGDETDRLHRWGYNFYRDMFSARQLLGLETSCRMIQAVADQRVRHALATNLSDLLRYQNTLCRYDTWALKSLDIFSVHGFPVGLIECESNLLGITTDKGTNVGSGGWTNIIEKYSKAKRYCDSPFEFERRGSRNVLMPIANEWIGEHKNGARSRKISIHCRNAAEADLDPGMLDAVFTDPPYFGNVQYGELMDFCYVWLRRLVGTEAEGFERESTRAAEELTGNVTKARGLDHFTDGLSTVYSRMAAALKPGAPLAFTYHHNKLEAYYAVGVAILDSGLTCSVSLPCPAEMGGSIHIHGTGSSTVDTVFVCRKSGYASRRSLFSSETELREVMTRDVSDLVSSGHHPTHGDRRCILYGHLTRMAIWNLRQDWDQSVTTSEKLERFKQAVALLADPAFILDDMQSVVRVSASAGPLFAAVGNVESHPDAVAF